MDKYITEAAQKILHSSHLTAFTGAGISVESGIPPFRGEGGLWNSYDPIVLDLDYFHQNPLEAWTVIHKLFYDFFGKADPNAAHIGLADLEKMGLLKTVITQNIDNLHQEAGNTDVVEFHGTAQSLVCTSCGKKFHKNDIDFSSLPVQCDHCNSLVKPDFIFFSEGIPPVAYARAVHEAENADILLIIGTSGEVMPASMIPHLAKEKGAQIIEINTDDNIYAHGSNDIFLQGKAGEIMTKLIHEIKTLRNE
jgi:NAD-dependent deacetylase